MAFNQTIGPIPFSVGLSILVKCVIESIVCVYVILLNILTIAIFLYAKRFRTTQNLLLINVSVTCILFSVACLLSISFTLVTLYTRSIQNFVCQCVGFLVIASCHCLMFSYTLVTLVRSLTIIFPFNRKITALQSIAIYLLLQWILAFLLPGGSFLLANERLVFQPKAKICSIDQHSPTLFMSFCTGYIIPLLLISAMNVVTYVSVTRSRHIPSLSKAKLSRLNKRKRRNLRLLRQFSVFTAIFIFGWTPFILVEVIDKDERLPDAFYLFTLLLPSMCVLVDSHVLLYCNKTFAQQIRSWWQTLTGRREPKILTRYDRTTSRDLSCVCIGSDV